MQLFTTFELKVWIVNIGVDLKAFIMLLDSLLREGWNQSLALSILLIVKAPLGAHNFFACFNAAILNDDLIDFIVHFLG